MNRDFARSCRIDVRAAPCVHGDVARSNGIDLDRLPSWRLQLLRRRVIDLDLKFYLFPCCRHLTVLRDRWIRPRARVEGPLADAQEPRAQLIARRDRIEVHALHDELAIRIDQERLRRSLDARYLEPESRARSRRAARVRAVLHQLAH